MPDTYALANDIFFEATEIVDPNARQKFLDQRCKDNAELRAHVDSLLAAHDPAAQFFANHARKIARAENHADALAGWAEGATVDRYQLLQQLGEGGFGIVFAAKQEEPVRRIVALKLIKPGMDTRDVIARFEAERQALAMMDHPHIARVLDAGSTQSGHPFFVMELVKGSPITEYCDKRNLSAEQRLHLFQLVCDAVQHAHQKGVVHRDLKPSNILVADGGGEPVPKVIDFGVAKAISQELTEKTLFTRFGQIIGTPQYMSPEQADIDAADVDTRSDIYSLGVVLYELLAGRTPLDGERLRSAGWNEMVRLIREEKTLRPSDRFFDSEDVLSIAVKRGLQPQSLRKKLRRDLDWVVLRAIDKDRGRRYESVGAFAEDISRYLNNQPVKARAPSAAYVARKFMLRHRVPVAVASILLISVLSGLAGTTLAWLRTGEARTREQHQRNAAVAERDRANETSRQLTSTLYKSLLDRAHEECAKGRFDFARELLEQCHPPERGWEWNHLWFRSKSREVATLPALGTPSLPPQDRVVYGIGTVPTKDGKGSFRAWNMETGEDRILFETEGRVALSSALSPSGDQFLTADYGTNVLRSIDTTSWSPQWETDIHRAARVGDRRFTDIRFSRSGDRFATLQGTGTIRVFDSTTYELLCRCEVGHHANNLAISPDGQIISAGGKSWRVETGELLYDVDLHEIWLSSCFNADGTMLVTVGFGENIHIWDASDGSPIGEFAGHLSWMSAVEFHPNDMLLVTGGTDTTLRVWDAQVGRHLWTIGNHRSVLTSLAISGDGQRVVSSGMVDNTFSTWNVFDADMLALHGHTEGITGVAFLPDGDRVATASVDGTIKIWNSQTGQLLKSIIASGEFIEGMAVHPTKMLAATICFESPDIDIWDLDSGKRITRLVGHTDYVFDVKFTPDGSVLVSAALDGNLHVWNLDTREIVRTMSPVAGLISEVAISSDSRFVAAQSEIKEEMSRACIRAWDIGTGESHSIVTGGSAVALEFIDSQDEENPLQVVVGKMTPVLRFANAHNGKTVAETQGRDNFFFDFAYHPETSRLWSASLDGNLTVWDLTTLEELVSIKAYSSPFWIAVSKDGATIATVAGDTRGAAKLFETKPIPRELMDRRAEVLAATMEVESRFRKHMFLAEVLQSFQDRPISDSKIHDRAIEIAEARGDNAVDLSRKSRKLTAKPGEPIAKYELALRQATVAVESARDILECHTALALAQYRLGDYYAAIKTISEADKLYESQKATRGPIRPGRMIANLRLLRTIIGAMALFQNGQIADAQLELDRFDSLCDEESVADTSIRAIYAEANLLFGR